MQSFFKAASLMSLTLVMALIIFGCSSASPFQQEERAPITRQEEKLSSPPREESPPEVIAPAPVSTPVLQASSSSTIKSPTGGLIQSSNEGAVSIDVKWMGPKDGSLIFDVAMNTHSVDLDRYDLGKLALLQDDEGKEYAASSWNSPPGGHHRRGTLAFPLSDSLAQGKSKFLQLIIRDVAGVKERAFKWKLG